MQNENENDKIEKEAYETPELVEHEPLTEITALVASGPPAVY